MIIDLNETNETPEFLCDLCIIGTGAAGLALASEMLNTPFNIILIESGGLEHEPKTQALYNADISGLPHTGTMEGRVRIPGGSTTKWAGQALPLMPIDFERRDWIPHSGWPVSFDDLTPYYRRASRFLLVDKMNFDSDLLTYLKTHPPAFDPSKILYHFSKWSPTPNIRENHLPSIKESDHCTLLLHANVTKIELDASLKQARQVEVHSLLGHRAIVKAKNFVICAGGIESARLLLSNNRQQPNGIGNDHDLVGRFFQDHPSAVIGWLKTSNPKQAQRLFNVFHKRKLKYSVRCTASQEWQRQQQTLNMSTGVTFVADNSALQDLKDVYRAMRHHSFDMTTLLKLFRAVGRSAAILSPAMHYVLRGRSYTPGAKLRIGLTSEQEPNPESRILLSERADALGTPLSNIRWKLTELTRYSMQQFATALRDEFQLSNIGKIEFEPWLFDNSSAWMEHVTDQFHHIGTTRMHDSPRYGVVDRNCRVHGIENLYIGSSAVFPTSGHSNPTLTIIALCIRLADRLKHELGFISDLKKDDVP